MPNCHIFFDKENVRKQLKERKNYVSTAIICPFIKATFPGGFLVEETE